MTTAIRTGTDHALTAASGEWAALSSRMTSAADAGPLKPQGRGAKRWAGRDDVVVTIAPGAGQGAPACFLPGLARIEINGDLLEVAPEDFYPGTYLDWDDAPATWGLLTHETAHVRFTTWLDDAQAICAGRVKDGTLTEAQAAKIAEVALLLEEARIETQQVNVRPADLRWLRASAAKHIVDEVTDGSVGSAVRTLALVGGRQQNDIIMPSEGNPALSAARAIVCAAPSRPGDITKYGTDRVVGGDYSQFSGTSRASRLLYIVAQACSLENPSATQMIGLAEQWISFLPKDEDEDAPTSGAAADMLGKLGKMADEIEEAGGMAPSETEEDSSPARYRALSWKPAEPGQKKAANALAVALQDYTIPERAGTPVADVLPPGRLRVRQAMLADAQMSRGDIPDAQPWRRIKHRVIPTPPLRVGIAVDVSGSMTSVEDHTWEIVFRFYTAFQQLADCEIQVWLAGEGTARAKLEPGKIPHYDYSHGCERVDLAIKKLRQKLALTRRGNARLLIVVSDAGFSHTEHRGSVQEITDLLKSGCRVLWLDCGYGYGSSYSTISDIQKLGAKYVKLTGTPDDAAKLAESELVKVMQDAGQAIRKGLTR